MMAADTGRIKRNVEKMISLDAPDAEIDAYLADEGFTAESFRAAVIEKPVNVAGEVGAVGSVLALTSEDSVNGSHRGHHQFHAKEFGHVMKTGPGGFPEVTPAVHEVLRRTLAEICGLADGFCRGRGGSMHLQWFEAGALGTNAIVGGGAPMATGNAWAQKHSGTDDLTINYFGDGAAQIGSVLESMNLALGLPETLGLTTNGVAP